MAGGSHSKTSTGYFETEYVQPWLGIDVSLPASQIAPGSATAFNGTHIRGGLSNAPAITPPQSTAGATSPAFATGEVPALITLLNGITIIVTNLGVWVDYSTTSPKVFSQVFTFPTAYTAGVHFGSVVIGQTLLFSSAEQRGVYEIGFAHSVVGLQLTSGGSGYSSSPTLTISGGGGTGATGTATFTPPSPVVFPLRQWPDLGNTSFNSSFVETPPTNVVFYSTGTFRNGVNNGFVVGGTATVSGCANAAINGTASVIEVNMGLPYTTGPTSSNFATNLTHTGSINPYNDMVGGSVSYVAPSPITSIALTSGGSGYITAPGVIISGGGGTGAAAVAILGPVTGITVIEITSQNGSGPFIGGDFLATIGQRLVMGNIIGGDGNQSLSVSSVIITNGGAGYPSTGPVIFTGGGGQNAQGTFNSTAGVITSITITNPGSGYLNAPSVSVQITPGSGFTGIAVMNTLTEPSTNTKYPDYFAWSFPSAYGSFDPNILSQAGGFDQLTEARGKITGIAVFESVAIIAHNGGFTEAAVNTSSAVGVNVQPFTFNPLWSADQGVVCRYGSMAQYGALVCFLGEDQTYTLNPNGLSPVADKVASLVQSYSQWTDGNFPNAGLYGSIVEIEGEKHYLVAFTSNDPTFGGNINRNTLVFDFNAKNWACSTWNLGEVTLTCPIYQSYDTQNLSGVLVRDNWLLTGVETTVGGAINCVLGQVVCGQQLFNSNGVSRYVSEAFSISFRAETPACGRAQANSTFWLEYENIPSQALFPPTLTVIAYGQPDINSQSTPTSPTSSNFALPMNYFALSSSVPPLDVLSMFGDFSNSAFTSLGTTLTLSTSGLVRIIRTEIIGQTGQGMQK